MLGVGLVGLGEIGEVYAQAVADSSSARLAAVCDVDDGRVQRTTAQYSTVGSRDVAEIIGRDDVDVVAICLPHNLHFPVALDAIAAGKHVLLEKPMAISVAECDGINAAARKKGVKVGVSHNRLFVPSIMKARELIDSGTIGVPIFIRHRIGIHDPYPGWRSDPAMTGGGILSDAGAHAFYVLRHLFGRIVDVRSILDVPPSKGEMLAIVSVRFACGAAGLIEGNYYGPTGQFDDSIEVVTKGSVMRLGGLEEICFGFRPQEPRFELYQPRTWTMEDVPAMNWQESVSASVRAFLEALDSDAPLPTTGEDGRENVRLIQQAYENAVFVGPFPGAMAAPVR
jgi:predicted dehydrogenase